MSVGRDFGVRGPRRERQSIGRLQKCERPQGSGKDAGFSYLYLGNFDKILTKIEPFFGPVWTSKNGANLLISEELKSKFEVVEVAGIEPASEAIFPPNLHV